MVHDTKYHNIHKTVHQFDYFPQFHSTFKRVIKNFILKSCNKEI